MKSGKAPQSPNRHFHIHHPIRKNDGKTLIAHISDLHFVSGTDHSDRIWAALREDLQSREVDLLIVTGDLIDNPISDVLSRERIRVAFENVYGYLSSALCGDLKIDPSKGLLVVPGNHDFRLLGIKGWRRIEFDMFYSRFNQQFGHRLLPSLRLCAFTFDSNTTDKGINFATGLVRSEDLIEFSHTVEQINKNFTDEWLASTRVAILHHHPMPIAATEHRGTVTEREEFLLLKNAGLFMNEMVKANIDLVFHGHKHYPAFSRVTFPLDDGREHTLTVLAGGSVGKRGIHDISYNLVTIEDNGEVSLERRVLRSSTYESHRIYSLKTYDDARRTRFERLADQVGARLKVNKYSRIDNIRAGSGDDQILEGFESVRSASRDPVHEISADVRSRSGYFGNRVYRTAHAGQRITWHWIDGPESRPIRRAITRFDPAIADKPITFEREGTIHNAIHFNRLDRLAATSQSNSEESADCRIKHVYQFFIHTVSFPKSQFPQPQSFGLHAYDPMGRRDYQEEAHIGPRFSVVPNTRTVILALSRPLPGYTYKILWNLPDSEIEELELGAEDAGLSEEIISKLIALRSDVSTQNEVRSCLEALRTDINMVDFDLKRKDNDDLELSLYCFDQYKSGLICVAAVGNYGPTSGIWSWVIPVGRTIVGQAYRRRSPVLCVQLPGIESEETVYYEPVPESEGRGLQKHTVIFAVPIFFPVRRGRRIAILSLASRSKTSSLLRLRTDKAAMLALIDHISVWYATTLAAALKLPRLPLDGNPH
jgi:3',5'-cyclic AMP phosphodiesterase CpdA